MPKNVNWRNYVDTAWVDRTNIGRSTGYSPQYLVYGFQGHADLNLLLNPIPKKIPLLPLELFSFRFKQLSFLDDQFASASTTSERSRQESKYYQDIKKEIAIPLSVGDYVLTWDKPIKNVIGAKSHKLKERWAGPYRIIDNGDRIYWLSTLDGFKIERGFAREVSKK